MVLIHTDDSPLFSMDRLSKRILEQFGSKTIWVNNLKFFCKGNLNLTNVTSQGTHPSVKSVSNSLSKKSVPTLGDLPRPHILDVSCQIAGLLQKMNIR